MLRVYLTDQAHFAEMNAAYEKFLTDPYPARTTVYTGLAGSFLVEIDALAVLD
jgi:2-iminobutanoate/2-iminopropanoate deaminase